MKRVRVSRHRCFRLSTSPCRPFFLHREVDADHSYSRSYVAHVDDIYRLDLCSAHLADGDRSVELRNSGSSSRDLFIGLVLALGGAVAAIIGWVYNQGQVKLPR